MAVTISFGGGLHEPSDYTPPEPEEIQQFIEDDPYFDQTASDEEFAAVQEAAAEAAQPEPESQPEPEPDPEPEAAPEPEPEPEAVLIELNRAELKEQEKEQEKEEELIVEEKDADESVQPPKGQPVLIMPPDDPDTAFSEMGMVYFAYDKSEITAEFEEVIQKNYEWIFQNPDAQVQLEGHCDERGTNEYNLALGERRAKAVFDYLVSLGANPSQFTIVSFGEERPVAYGSNEASWRQNRRVEFTQL